MYWVLLLTYQIQQYFELVIITGFCTCFIYNMYKSTRYSYGGANIGFLSPFSYHCSISAISRLIYTDDSFYPLASFFFCCFVFVPTEKNSGYRSNGPRYIALGRICNIVAVLICYTVLLKLYSSHAILVLKKQKKNNNKEVKI